MVGLLDKETFIPCSIVLHFGVGARPFRDMPLYSKGRSTSVASRGRLASRECAEISSGLAVAPSS
jgi:hypothetical protein